MPSRPPVFDARALYAELRVWPKPRLPSRSCRRAEGIVVELVEETQLSGGRRQRPPAATLSRDLLIAGKPVRGMAIEFARRTARRLPEEGHR